MTKHKDNIIKLRDQGKSYTEIQKILGCSKGTISFHLGEGQKEKYYARTNRSRTIKKRELWDLKELSGCVDCKEKYPHFMLDFDHLPEFEKLGSPTQIIATYSSARALVEVAKCEVVCANCHRIRTWNRSIETIGL